jgi:hypothetical protein
MSTPHLRSDKELRDELLEVLRNFSSTSLGGSFLQSWLLVQEVERKQNLTPTQALRRCLIDTLGRLAEQNPEGATILRRHYLEGVEVRAIACELAQVEGTINKKQRQAIAELAALLSGQEAATQIARQRRVEQRFGPPAPTCVFSNVELEKQISALLNAAGPPWLIAIHGIGGSGKTALAGRIMRAQADSSCWREVAWLPPQQRFNTEAVQPHTGIEFAAGLLFDMLYEQLIAAPGSMPPPAAERQQHVRAMLRNAPHLIVIDDLSSLVEGDPLLALLAELAAPSKFLVTLRHSLHDIDGVCALHMPELALHDIKALLRWEAQTRNLSLLARVTNEDCASIYAVIGGNLLAARLVASETQAHSLNAVLECLQQGNGKHVEALYAYIYRHAWNMLEEKSKQLLLLLPGAGAAGADAEFLRQISGMDLSALYDALDQLMTFNLVDGRGNLNARSYSIRNLTRTFLRGHALRW